MRLRKAATTAAAAPGETAPECQSACGDIPLRLQHFHGKKGPSCLPRNKQKMNSRGQLFRCRWSVNSDGAAAVGCRALEWHRRARARATSCFWPADRGAPPSERTRSRPRGVASTISDRCARRSAAQHSASLCSPNGVRLKRSVPVNSTGTCTQCGIATSCGSFTTDHPSCSHDCAHPHATRAPVEALMTSISWSDRGKITVCPVTSICGT